MYKEQIIPERIPEHIAIVMDGNGRWAKSKGLPRVFGHRQGVKAVHRVTEEAVRLGIRYLTLYTFSTENWNRPKEEIDALMNLLVDTIDEERPTLMNNNVRLLTIGDTDRLPEAARRKFLKIIEDTSANTGMSLVLALSYSSRWEIVEAAKALATKAANGEIRPEQIDEQLFADSLTTRNIPDPDLLIRTSGEYRISNYLLWQLAYSEFYFTDRFWPDFDEEELCRAIVDYQHRERRFGKTSEQLSK